MARSENQRLKLLYLIKILSERTDEEHAITMAEILEALAAQGISAERKSIYSDLAYLREFGFEIEMTSERVPGYYLIGREFELAELKLLVDAVQSAYFITEKKSDQLITKITSLASKPQAKQLKRHIYVADRPKSLNERVYYSVDALHTAINEGKMISFLYFEYNLDKQCLYHKKGERYIRMPLELCWSDDNYYLVCYSPKHEGIAHYRVDRMDNVEVTNESSDQYTQIRKSFNLADHTNKAFGMFTGETVRATLRFDNSLVNVVIDRFGTKVLLREQDGCFETSVEIYNSPTFFGWMLQFGEKAEIVAPKELREEMHELIKNAAKRYSQNIIEELV